MSDVFAIDDGPDSADEQRSDEEDKEEVDNDNRLCSSFTVLFTSIGIGHHIGSRSRDGLREVSMHHAVATCVARGITTYDRKY